MGDPAVQGTWSAYEKRMLSPCPRSEGDPDMIQGSPSDNHRYMAVVHSYESRLSPAVHESLLHFVHLDDTPYKVQRPSPPETINGGSHDADNWTTY